MPTSGIGYPSGALVGGNSARSAIFSDYIFNSGLIVPSHSAFLTEKFGSQYTMTTLLDKIGAYKPVYNNVMSWSVMDRTRANATISSGVAGLPAASLTLTTDVA